MTMATHSDRRALLRVAAIALALGSASAVALSSASAQQVYPTPEAAMKDLIDSAKAGAPGFGDRIFGAGGANLLRSGNKAEDQRHLAEFNEVAAEAASLEVKGEDTRIVHLGKVGWTFPVPIAKSADGWRFDVAAGREEIVDRAVGHNEFSAIAACRAYVKAQDEYFRIDRDGNALREYARRIVSRPGKHDGLYWEPKDQADISPLGDLNAGSNSADEKYPLYNGYRFKILTGQGAAAPGSAHSYLVNGHMISGHALLAWPNEWGVSGIQSFICGESGKIFEKNFGQRSNQLGRSMQVYNPDKSWKLVE
jgi:hypothetical protein